MATHDTFWKRAQKQRGEFPDVYTYDKLPISLRVQIIHVIHDTIGTSLQYYHYATVKKTYIEIVNVLRRELGVFKLPYAKHADTLLDELISFIINEENVEYVLGAIELVCDTINEITSHASYIGRRNAAAKAAEAINEINQRFKEHGVGYEYDEEIIRIDSEFIHAEAVKPALSLLRDSNYSGAEDEFSSAYEHYRRGSEKEALVDALKAIESTLKSIFDKRKWTYGKGDTIRALIEIAFNNDLIPSFWQSHFTGIRTTLESGVPTARNKEAGHGQGSETKEVPAYLTSYVLHLTASTIVFLVNAEKQLPQLEQNKS